MKKIFTIVLAVVMLATMGGVALAAAVVDPAEVNIVLPAGEEAKITKTVTDAAWGDGVLVERKIKKDDDLKLSVKPKDGATTVGGVATFTEKISVDVGPGPLYATVTFLVKGEEVGTQEISVTEGDLDVKPGSFPNSINCKKKGVTPVAILGNAKFDVTTVVLKSIKFCNAGAAPVKTSIEDVNYDGNPDLVCHFKTQALKLYDGQKSCKLSYELPDTTVVTISDSVRPLHCPPPK
jgi:hypothetical protein